MNKAMQLRARAYQCRMFADQDQRAARFDEERIWRRQEHDLEQQARDWWANATAKEKADA